DDREDDHDPDSEDQGDAALVAGTQPPARTSRRKPARDRGEPTRQRSTRSAHWSQCRQIRRPGYAQRGDFPAGAAPGASTTCVLAGGTSLFPQTPSTGPRAPRAYDRFAKGAGGFEPPEAEPTGLQPVPFG